MKVLKPDYFDSFKCSASDCTDTCCTLWQVEVDENSAAKYKLHISAADEIGLMLGSGLIGRKKCTFKQKCDCSCIYLNDNLLCDLQTEGGHDMLPQTCRIYPRFINTYGAYEETGLSFSCPAAANIITENQLRLAYEEDDRAISVYTQVDANVFYYVRNARNMMIDIINSSTSSVDELISRLLTFAQSIQENINSDNYDAFPEDKCSFEHYDIFQNKKLKRRVTVQHLKNEILRDEWRKVLSSSYCNQVRTDVDEFKCWISYFIFRYVIRACEDKEFYSRVKAGLISYMVIASLPYDFKIAAQKYSKEIEHNGRNIKRLFKMSRNTSFKSIEKS